MSQQREIERLERELNRASLVCQLLTTIHRLEIFIIQIQSLLRHKNLENVKVRCEDKCHNLCTFHAVLI